MGRFVEIHEAGHAVVGHILGMSPIEVRATLNENPCTIHDQAGMHELLSSLHARPDLLWCVVRSVHLVAGGCAEAVAGRDPDHCAWFGDEKLYTPLLETLALQMRGSYEFYLRSVSELTMALLQSEPTWKTVRLFADALSARKTLDEKTARAILAKWLDPSLGPIRGQTLGKCVALLTNTVCQAV